MDTARDRLTAFFLADLPILSGLASAAAVLYTGGWMKPLTFTRNARVQAAQPGSAGFRALLTAARRDADIVLGLAYAYAELSIQERWALLEAILGEAGSENVEIASIFAAFMALEDNTHLCAYLGRLLGRDGGRSLVRTHEARSFAAVTADSGAVVLVQPLYGVFFESLLVRFRAPDVIVETSFEPLLHERDIRAHARGSSLETPFEERPIGYSTDLIAPVLWGHRRRYGFLPDELARFAPLFGGVPHAM